MTRTDTRSPLVTALLIWLGFLAGWTVGSVPLTLIGAPFASLWIALITGVLGALLALRARRDVAALLLVAPAPQPITRPPMRRLVLVALGALGILGATAVFIPTGDARLLWALTLLVGLAALWFSRQDNAPAQWDAQPAPGLPLTALVAAALWLIYVLILRHDADDAFYLNLPMTLADAPHGMLVWDTMYGAENWPLLGSNYRVEAIQTLIGALSSVTGLSAAFVAHLVLPTIWCAVWAATWALLGTSLFGRNTWVFVGLAILTSFAFAGSLQSWGVHGITRLFHGKAPLILIVVPLLFLLTHRADAQDMPLRRIIPLQAGLICVAMGLTANAIYLAPLVLGLALCAGWITRGFGGIHRLFALLAALPAVLAGLWLLIFDTPVTVPPDANRTFEHLALWSMFPSKLMLGLMALTAIAASLGALLVTGARFVAACLVATLIFVVNPFIWPIYDSSVTGGLNFRLWWAIPVPLFAAAALTWGTLNAGPTRVLVPASAAALIILSFLPSGIFGSPGTKITPSLIKRPAPQMAVAQAAINLAQGRTVLAPEEIAAWIPTLPGHPPQVYVRRLYLDQNMTVVAPEALAPRRVLADWINDGEATDLTQAIADQCPEVLVVRAENPPAGLAQLLERYRGQQRAELPGYQIHEIAPGCS